MRIRTIWVAEAHEWDMAFLFYAEDSYTYDHDGTNWHAKLSEARDRYPAVHTADIEIPEKPIAHAFNNRIDIQGEWLKNEES